MRKLTTLSLVIAALISGCVAGPSPNATQPRTFRQHCVMRAVSAREYTTECAPSFES
jgi:hypothetical protein